MEITVKDELETKSFQEAFDMTGYGNFNRKKLLLGGICLVGVMMESLESGYLLPIVECELNMNIIEKGLFSTSTFIGILCSSHMWGYLADCKGRRGVMLPGIILTVICSIFSSFAPNAWFLILMKIMTGFFQSSLAGTIFVYVGEFHTDKDRSKAIARVAIFISIAIISLPAIGWGVLPFGWHTYVDFLGITLASWRLFIIVCCLPNIIGAIWLYGSSESPKYLIATGKYEETLEVLKNMYEENHKGETFPIKSLKIVYDLPPTQNSGGLLKSLWRQTAPLFQPTLLPSLLMAMFNQFTIFLLSSGLYLWFPDILNKLLKSNSHTITICEAINKVFGESESLNSTTAMEINCSFQVSPLIFQVGIGIGFVALVQFLFIGLAVDKIGKKLLLAIIIALPGFCTISLYWAKNIYLIIVLYVLLTCCGCAGGLSTSVAVDLFPTKLRAMAITLSLMVGRIGAIVGANLAGYLFKTSCDYAFLIFGAEVLLCSACTFLWPKPETIKAKLAKKGVEF